MKYYLYEHTTLVVFNTYEEAQDELCNLLDSLDERNIPYYYWHADKVLVDVYGYEYYIGIISEEDVNFADFELLYDSATDTYYELK